MFRFFFLSRKWLAWAWGGTLFLAISILVQVQITVKINIWYRDFYNLLQKPEEGSLEQFWEFIWQFSHYAFPYVIIATFTAWFTRMYSLKWREAMTWGFIPLWQQVTHEIEGSSQRIQEDAFRFARIMESLALSVFRAILTLISFIPILWGLSENVEIPILKNITGSLVWLALLVSVGGLIISWFVGIKLPTLEYNNQKVEAAFRKELVYAEDNKRDYGHTETLLQLFIGVKFNYRKLYFHYGYFDIWSNIFEQIMIIFPLIIMGPSLFAGVITFGIITQVSNAFDRVRDSFSIFILRWTDITEMRSIHKRIKEFEHNLVTAK